ncbi:hypothetical protein PUN28_018449 [Cardiocondyla obscurior]|uniref:Uncharacterized protein n=1 Tax=Cardiocondyla obscurior TaxID=286306 RepID=A0AAW2EFA9_9HYME
MPPINGDYQNLDLSKAPIRLEEPEKLKVTTERSERSSPPTSPAPEEVPQNVENPRELSPSPNPPRTNVNATEPEPDSEQFRPTTPSYSPDISIHSPGAAPRACSSPIPSTIPHPGEPEEVDSFADDDTVFWQESDGPELSLPAPSVEFLGGQEEPRAIVDPLLELLRRTCSPWTDPVPERAFTIGPDSFDPEEIRREASRASPDQNVLIFYPGVEHPFLAPIRLIDRVFPRSSARISEIIEIELD